MEIIVIMAIVSAGIGYAIDGIRGLALGAVLGVIGLLISAILRNSDAKS